MINIPSILKNYMHTTESIIYSSNENFTVSGGGLSFTGTQTMYLSDANRIYVHDTGGFFKGDGLLSYDYPKDRRNFIVDLFSDTEVVATLKNIPVNFINNKGSKFFTCSIDIYLDVEKFIELRFKYPNLNFKIADDKAITYLTNSYYNSEKALLTKVKPDDTNLLIDFDDTLSIPKNFVDSYTLNHNLLEIKGIFISEKGKLYDSIQIYHDNIENLSENIKPDNNQIKSHELDATCFITQTDISGYINDTLYDNEDILVMENFKSEDKKYILIADLYTRETIRKFYLDETKIFQEYKDTYTLVSNGELCTILLDESNFTNLKLSEFKKYEKQNLALTNDIPLFIKYDEENIYFNYSESINYWTVNYKEIKDISFYDDVEWDENYFGTIEISIENEDRSFEIPLSKGKTLIRNTFYYSKKDSITKASTKQIFGSWAKSLNEVFNFHIFASIHNTKTYIDNNYSQDIDNQKKIEILNTVYLFIQEERKKHDILAAYLPKMIENAEEELFKGTPVRLDSKRFKLFQKQLFSLTGQINRSFAEIERAIAPVSSYIYTSIDVKKMAGDLRDKQSKIGMATSIGASLVLGSALAVPFLVSNAVGMYANKKVDKLQNEVETEKLTRCLNNLVDKYNHFYYNMLPYYIGESNDILFEIISYLRIEYPKVDNTILKDVLFNRMTDLYTFKNMPVYNKSTEKRKNIIKEISELPNNKYYSDGGYSILI